LFHLGFFTLGISRIFQVETLTPTKIGAVCTSFLGVVLVALSDSSQTSSNVVSTPISTYLLGDLLALFSAVFYAFYVILLKVRIRSESRIDMKLFFGFVGLFNIISCWPIGVILHFAGVEKFELPSTNKAIGAILVNMAITWSSDYLYVLAMLKTTPLVVTIGLSLTIPLAVVGDFFLSKPTQLQVLAGALLVLISFVVVGVDDVNVEQPEKDRVDESQHLLHSDSHDRQRPVVHVNVEVDSDMH
jgi:solute carrier family 35, member F5